MYWQGFGGDNITIVGYQHESNIHADVKKHSLSELREKGLGQVMQHVLTDPMKQSYVIAIVITCICLSCVQYQSQ